MKQPSRNQTLAPKYLMGKLSERERDELEEKYFNDDELFGELLDAEDQLIDDYRRGRLSPRERERFEQRFLTLPDRLREVEFARMLAESLAERRPANLPAPNAEPAPHRQSLFGWLLAPRSVPGWAMAAASLIVVIGLGWAVMNTSRLQAQLEQSQASQVEQLELERKERARVEEELASLQARAIPTSAIIALALTPGGSRSSGEDNKITPGPGTTVIELTLGSGAENYAGYQATLQRAADESVELLIYKRLEAKTTGAGKNVVVRLPAAMLDTDDYQIKLEGISPQGETKIIGNYRFKVRP
ncbi:MAG: hypothetical protein ACRD9Y_20495, partial [Blastocatellia bacterium]